MKNGDGMSLSSLGKRGNVVLNDAAIINTGLYYCLHQIEFSFTFRNIIAGIIDLTLYSALVCFLQFSCESWQVDQVDMFLLILN